MNKDNVRLEFVFSGIMALVMSVFYGLIVKSFGEGTMLAAVTYVMPAFIETMRYFTLDARSDDPVSIRRINLVTLLVSAIAIIMGCVLLNTSSAVCQRMLVVAIAIVPARQFVAFGACLHALRK